MSGRRWRIGFPRCWPPSAAQTVHAVFPHTAFTKTHASGMQSKVFEWTFFAAVGLIQSNSLLGRKCTGISLMELIHLSVLTHCLPLSSQPSSPAAFPNPFCCRLPGHLAFTRLEVLLGRPTTDRALLAISLSLIGPLTPVPPGDPASPPEVTHCSSVPCRPQTPWCGG